MEPVPEIHRVWPGPDGTPLTDEAIAAAYPRLDRPHLRVNFVTSVDGAVALDGYSAGLSGEADKRVFKLLRGVCDALLVGAGTLRHEGYGPVRLDAARRAWRREQGLAEYPTLVVVSGRLDLTPDNPALAAAPVRPIVLTCGSSAAERRKALAEVADVQVYGETELDLTAALDHLRSVGLRQLLCEGGPHLFGALTSADLVDELCLTVSPLLAGPGAARITAGTPSPPRPLALAHVLAAGDVLLLRYLKIDKT